MTTRGIVCSALAGSMLLTGCAHKPAKSDMPQIVSMQLVLDPVQARYPGNQGHFGCGPTNHDDVCIDWNARHIVNHIYIHKENCEAWERVSCTRWHEDWAPIGKPVFEEVKP